MKINSNNNKILNCLLIDLSLERVSFLHRVSYSNKDSSSLQRKRKRIMIVVRMVVMTVDLGS